MRDQYIQSGDGFLLVYSVTDRWSFHALTAFREQILAVKGQKHRILPDIPLILVGNKVRVNKLKWYILLYCIAFVSTSVGE